MYKSPGLALLLSSAAAAQCLAAPGAAIAISQDTISAPQSIGFLFPLYGASYSDIHVSDHGICFFSNAGTPAPPAAVPLVYTPDPASLVANGPVVCPFWSDTIPGTSGTFHIDAQPTQCTITWSDVQSFGFAQPLMTFQLALFPNGEIEFVYDPNVTNNSTYAAPADNAVIGISPGLLATLPTGIDLSGSPTTTDATLFELFPIANGFDMRGDSLRLIPTNPGWMAVFTADGSGCAWVDPYGAGCDGLALTSTDPALGQNWVLTTSGLNIVSQIGFTFFAFGRANPSLPLSAFGLDAPGCWGHLPPNGVITRLIGANVNGTMSVTVTMPAVAPHLIGESWTNQTFAFTNQNNAGLASSNAVHCTMGN